MKHSTGSQAACGLPVPCSTLVVVRPLPRTVACFDELQNLLSLDAVDYRSFLLSALCFESVETLNALHAQILAVTPTCRSLQIDSSRVYGCLLGYTAANAMFCSRPIIRRGYNWLRRRCMHSLTLPIWSNTIVTSSIFMVWRAS
jgi:hypothetical protein